MYNKVVTPLFLCLSLCGSLLMAGCMTTPQNGHTFDGSTTGSHKYGGWTPVAGELIEVQVLADATADPTDDSKWVTLRTTRSTLSPHTIDTTGTIWFSWLLDASSTSKMWPQGGLQRVRVCTDRFALATFDEVYSACFTPKVNAGEGFAQAGSECASPYGFATLVSTTPSPADLANPNPPKYLSFLNPSICEAQNDPSMCDEKMETDHYYANILAPPNLEKFKQAYGFDKNDEFQVVATYFNYPDLGLVRPQVLIFG